MEVENGPGDDLHESLPKSVTGDHKSSWCFEGVLPDPAGNVGVADDVAHSHCNDDQVEVGSRREDSTNQSELQLVESSTQLSPSHDGAEQEEETPAHNSWPGWAELENDPEIFTILLQEWGMRNLKVNEVYDITELLDIDPSSIFGLVFLSRYVAPDQSRATSPSQATNSPRNQPWFTNQISKFSCGTVALMNILMNIKSPEVDLSTTLSDFRSATSNMNAKHRGVALDTHTQFRNIHNSFSTKLDQCIVDVLLKEEVTKAKQKAQAQTRTTKKRKRVTLTKKRKYKKAFEDDEENGFHFVAYISAYGNVWKLDGMRPEPEYVGPINEGQTWLNVTVQDVLPLLQDAFNADQQCTMMNVTKSEVAHIVTGEEKTRKQEDWAPFIETLLRIHAERGDLNEMLGL